jgi:hypothetical protein
MQTVLPPYHQDNRLRLGSFVFCRILMRISAALLLPSLLLTICLREARSSELDNTSTITVVTVDHLSWSSFETSRLPEMSLLREHGAVALLSPGLARFPEPEGNQWATFTAGDVINVKNDHLGLLERQLLANGLEGKAVILRFGDVDSADRLLSLDRLLSANLKSGGIVLLCCITPPQSAAGSWNQLTPVVIYPALANSMTSATTRTPGLIAIRDVAPTVLSIVGAPIPTSMTGAPATFCNIGRSANVGVRDVRLSRMATITELGQNIIVPLCWFLGLAALFAVAGGAWVASGHPAASYPVICYLLRLIIAAPLALLIAPCFPVNSLPTYMGALLAVDIALAYINSPTLLIGATTLVIVVDALTGSHLIAVTVISGFWLSGIRFYGIGNEYMGILIGMALLTPVLIFQNPSLRLSKGIKSLLTAFCYLFVIFVLSYPAFGAKAGGAVTSVVAFSLAWIAIYVNKRPACSSFVVASIAGFALIFALAAFASRLHAPPSHIQAAVGALHHGRLGYIKHVAIRKAKMAIKTVLTPGGIVATLGFIPLVVFWRRSNLRARIDEYLIARPDLAGALQAGGWGLVASLLYNDSGGVAFLFFFGAMALVLLHEMVKFECVSSR